MTQTGRSTFPEVPAAETRVGDDAEAQTIVDDMPVPETYPCKARQTSIDGAKALGIHAPLFT